MRKKWFYRSSVLFAATVAAVVVSGCSNEKEPTSTAEGETEIASDDAKDPVKDDQAPDKKPFYEGMSMSQTPDVSEL